MVSISMVQANTAARSSRTGYGLVDYQGNRRTAIGGLNFGLSTPLVDNQCLSLAMVRDSGITTLYVNGVSVATGLTTAENIPTGNFILRGPFIGTLDRARFFTFTPGSFSTADLLVPVLEPASFVLIGFGLAALGYARRRTQGSRSAAV